MRRLTVAGMAMAFCGLTACGPVRQAPAPEANSANAAQPYAGNAWGGAAPPAQGQAAWPSPIPDQQSPYAQPPGQAGAQPSPYGQQGVAPGAPGGAAQAPGAQGGAFPQPQGAFPAPQGGFPAPQGAGGLQVSGPPQGMSQTPSQAGYVFTSHLAGSPQASKLIQAEILGVTSYFDAAPQIVGKQTDPTDRMSQVAFRATLHGAPVMGVMAVSGDGHNDALAYLLFDAPDRVQSSMPQMMAAVRQPQAAPAAQ